MKTPKTTINPENIIYPIPAVMVSCGNNPEEYNIITIAWTGTINSIPPMCYISVRKERFSYEIIKKNKEFVINLTTEEIAKQTDFCGLKSGKKVNKFSETKLTAQEAQIVGCPIIAESPVNIECKVNKIISLGSHDMFIADIVAINVSDQYIDPKTNNLLFENINFINYIKGDYYKIGSKIGKTGFSLK